MANNYCESSSFIKIDPGYIEQAGDIVTRVLAEFEETDEGCGIIVDVEEHGVFIRGEETFNAEQAAVLVKALVEELSLEGVRMCSWAYTCSKPRIDEFGGGAFAVVKGQDTIFIDAASEVFNRAIALLGKGPAEE